MRNVLITGAGSGLGRDLCRYFAARDYQVLATDVDEEAVQETVAALPTGSRAHASSLDVTCPDAIARCLAQSAITPIQVLINNAGIQQVARLEEFPPERWAQLIDVMLTGPALLMRACLPGMRLCGYGRMVNIGSIHSLVASPFKSAYVAAKHGLLGLTKTLALETNETDITVNTLCPSYIRTPLVEKQIADQSRLHGLSQQEVIEQIMLQPMPKRQFITSEEIAGTIEFLLSPTARNITGQAIAIDGGWTCR